MTTCDMCGTEKGPFYNGEIEKTKMKLCNNCKGYAKEAWLIKDTIPQQPKKKVLYSEQKEQKKNEKKTETIQLIVADYGKRIKQAREKLGIKQEVLAKRLAEKESVLHTWENQHRKPNIETARKLEKTLNITLVEQREIAPLEKRKTTTGPITIADLIKKK